MNSKKKKKELAQCLSIEQNKNKYSQQDMRLNNNNNSSVNIYNNVYNIQNENIMNKSKNNYQMNNNNMRPQNNNNIININTKTINNNQILNINKNQISQPQNKIQNNNQKKMKNNTVPNPVNKKPKEEPIKLYKKPTLIGLNNIGSTCFKNSVLQCLSQTEDLTNYFLRKSSLDAIFNNNIAKNNNNSLQLCPVYYELIKNLWAKNSIKSFSPNNFMDLIDKMSKKDILTFQKGEAGDAKDFIIFILEQFHKELKKPVKEFNNNISKNIPLNQYDRNNAFKHFIDSFKENCSIISDIFFGINETTNTCLNCKNRYNSKGLNEPICYNYGIFNCLIFPLEEVKKMKNKSFLFNNIQMNYNNRVSLDECFFYNQKSEYFTGQNKNYCNICKQLSDSIYGNNIFSSPNVLILILNRGKGNIYNVKIDFQERIDITRFILQKDIPSMIYNLYGVITHIGESGPSAHFIASCKSPVDNKWYKYNDAIVSPISNVQKEVIEFGTPYILFYRKVKVNNN